jgi:hypothetical protein
MRHALPALLAAALLTACGPRLPFDGGKTDGGTNTGGTDGGGGGGGGGSGSTARPPTQEEIDLAKARIEVAVHAAERARSALELLGILPVYTCGESRRTFVGRAVESTQVQLSCLTATSEARGDTADAVVLAFAAEGCSARGHTVAGTGEFLYSGGEDRMELFADLRELTVDATALQTKVGYGTCSDEKRYWAESAGTVPARLDHTYALNARVAQREGGPIFGGTTLLIDASGTVTGPAGTDAVTITGLEYELGEYFPKQGELLITTAGGKTLRATFRASLWRLGQVEVRVDTKDPVTVPIVR